MTTFVRTIKNFKVMLVEVKTLSVVGYGTPTIEDLREAQQWTSDNVVVRLIYKNAYSSVYEVLIEKDTDIDELFKICR